MAARAPGKVVLALPPAVLLTGIVLVLTARVVIAPSDQPFAPAPAPAAVHAIATPRPPSASTPVNPGSSSGDSLSQPQKPGPGSLKVKTGSTWDRAPSCTSRYCPR